MQSVISECVSLLLEAAKEIPITVQSWTKHMPKMTQPNLDYIGEMSVNDRIVNARPRAVPVTLFRVTQLYLVKINEFIFC